MPIRICPKCQLEIDTEEPFCPRDGTRLLSRSVYDQIARETDPLVGQRIAERYLVIRKLGEGGMGEVYLAEHEDIEKRLALKVRKHEYSTRADVVARFKQEAISASRIKHPNVVDVFDFGQLDDGRFYLAMEWLDGSDLADALATKGTLEPARGVAIAMQMCRALAAAHAKGVVHRDLKPENIFLCVDEVGQEQVKIVDFGICKNTDRTGALGCHTLTQKGVILGTPHYMAPEQAQGLADLDGRADLWSVGVIMFECLAGHRPFSGDNYEQVIIAICTQSPPSLRGVAGVADPIADVVSRAMRQSRDKRFSSAREYLEALRLAVPESCLLYTSDAADDLLCVDLGGRRIIKKKKKNRKKIVNPYKIGHETTKTGIIEHIATTNQWKSMSDYQRHKTVS